MRHTCERTFMEAVISIGFGLWIVFTALVYRRLTRPYGKGKKK